MLRRSATGALLAVPLVLGGMAVAPSALAHPDPQSSTPSAGEKMATPLLMFKSRGPAVADLQRKLGIKDDGIFGKQTMGKVIDLQLAKGETPDGVVGPLTWAYVNDPNKPAKGASFKATGKKRIVTDKHNNIVFAIRPDGSVERWMWMVDNNVATKTKVTRITERIPVNRNIENEKPGSWELHYFVRFDGKPGNGFHAIPKDKTTKDDMHSVNQLGAGTRQQSLGCVRLAYENAKFLYSWAPVGTEVNTVDRIRPGL